MVSADHHHGEAETGIYVVSGHPVFVFLEDGEERRVQTGPGDYIYVPPYVPHREENPSPDEEAVVVLARSTQEGIVVNLPSLRAEVPELDELIAQLAAEDVVARIRLRRGRQTEAATMLAATAVRRSVGLHDSRGAPARRERRQPRVLRARREPPELPARRRARCGRDRARRAFLPSGGTVLDLGCGNGRVALALAARGFQVEGLDISPSMIEEARAAAAAAGVDARFRVGDAVELPQDENGLDAVVFACNGIGHLTRDGKVACLVELQRVLRPGGVALLSLRTPYALNRMLPRLLRNVVLPRKGLRPDEESDGEQYVQRPPLSWLVGQCREARLDPVCVCSHRQAARRRSSRRARCPWAGSSTSSRRQRRGAYHQPSLSSIVTSVRRRVCSSRAACANAMTSSPRPWASAALRMARRCRMALP